MKPEPTKAYKLANPNNKVEEIVKEFENTFSIALRHMKIDDKSITYFLEQALHQAKEQGRREGVEGGRKCTGLFHWVDDCGGCGCDVEPTNR